MMIKTSWVSVKEKLPTESRRRCLVLRFEDGYKNMFIALWNADGKRGPGFYQEHDNSFWPCRVTYWLEVTEE